TCSATAQYNPSDATILVGLAAPPATPVLTKPAGVFQNKSPKVLVAWGAGSGTGVTYNARMKAAPASTGGVGSLQRRQSALRGVGCGQRHGCRLHRPAEVGAGVDGGLRFVPDDQDRADRAVLLVHRAPGHHVLLPGPGGEGRPAVRVRRPAVHRGALRRPGP